jgi:hypothetical protein
VFAVLIDEQVHHGAEVALLRDLYRDRKRAPHTVTAIHVTDAAFGHPSPPGAVYAVRR